VIGRRRLGAALAVAAVLAIGGDADAAQCSISTTPVAFGDYDVLSPLPVDSVGAVIYQCNGGADVIAITISAGSGGTFTPRKLASVTDWLAYNLYRDPNRSVIWGNGTSGTSFYYTSSIPNNRDVSVPVYGRIAPSQDVRAGIYTDNVSVTVNF
jgi:spore coat protein U-like protein